MIDEYIHVTGQDGEIYEVLPTDALLSFLQRMAEDETEEREINPQNPKCVNAEVAYF
ncbi:MAG TPA: hypothetical protein VN729_08100 [Ktedonobacteraceae bacterium]|nr:hypothetical protein [Ktedonobacteraceae bacterium]